MKITEQIENRNPCPSSGFEQDLPTEFLTPWARQVAIQMDVVTPRLFEILVGTFQFNIWLRLAGAAPDMRSSR
jgi:hypothetical protein